MTFATRKPTGKPAWPVTLIAGVEKGGKTYTAAEASACDKIDRTFWFAWGEDEPDEYGMMDGQRIEIVPHDGTVPGLISQIEAAKAQPHEPGRPHLIVLDSGTRLWNYLSDLAQVEADDRARRKASSGKGVDRGDGNNDIGMDLWNRAKTRHAAVIKALRSHDGPVIITARMDEVTVMVNGQPTRDGRKDWKIQTEKSLPFEVGAIVRIPERGKYQLTGVRSLRLQLTSDQMLPVPDFTMAGLWERLGLFEDADNNQGRSQQHLDPAEAAAKVQARRAELLSRAAEIWNTEQRWQQIDGWWQQQHGEHIDETEDFVALERIIAQAHEKHEQQRREHEAQQQEQLAGDADQAHQEGAGQ